MLVIIAVQYPRAIAVPQKPYITSIDPKFLKSMVMDLYCKKDYPFFVIDNYAKGEVGTRGRISF